MYYKILSCIQSLTLLLTSKVRGSNVHQLGSQVPHKHHDYHVTLTTNANAKWIHHLCIFSRLHYAKPCLPSSALVISF